MRGLILAALLLAGPAAAQTLSGPTGAVAIVGSGAFTAVRVVTTGTADTATDTVSTTIKWTSTTAAAKAETLPACAAGNKALTFVVKDGAGTATAYPIAITAPSSTFDGAASYSLNVNRAAVAIQCDGAGDWSVQ